MKLTQKQIDFLNRYTIGSWSLNPKTGLVNIKGDFNCPCQELESLQGVKFGKVSGYFDCRFNNLTSLEGAPQKVGGNFNCNDNNLTSLEGAPQEVGGGFCCSYNNLTSLEGGPQKVGGNFHCGNNKLTSLEGAPQEVGVNFNCYYNNLTSLEGAPKEVGGGFYCHNNPIKEELLEMIWERMKGGIPYFIVLHSLKQEIEDFKKESKDKKSYDLLLNQIVDEELAKGACLLNKFGIYS